MRKYGALAILLLLVLGATWSIHAWRYRFVRDNQDLLRYLPAAAGTTLFVDVELLRRGGVLEQMVAPRSIAQDPDYREFVRETKFDYARDLDALAGKTGAAPVLAARGVLTGPDCASTLCTMVVRAKAAVAKLRPAQMDGGSSSGKFSRTCYSSLQKGCLT